MKAKINDTIYNSEEQPIMVILSEKDKENIANMPKEKTKYCSYPDTPYFKEMQKERILVWMDIGK